MSESWVGKKRTVSLLIFTKTNASIHVGTFTNPLAGC